MIRQFTEKKSTNTNYGYTKEELLEYPLDTIKKIANKYGLNSSRTQKSIISDILAYQDKLEATDSDVDDVSSDNDTEKSNVSTEKLDDSELEDTELDATDVDTDQSSEDEEEESDLEDSANEKFNEKVDEFGSDRLPSNLEDRSRSDEEKIDEKEAALVRKINGDINVLPGDVLRLIAINLSFTSIAKLCRTNKKFNSQICQDKLFQKQYGLKHLTSHLERLKTINGKYNIIMELDKLEKLKKKNINSLFDYLGRQGYEIYISKLRNVPREASVLLLRKAAENGYLDIVMFLVENVPNIHNFNDVFDAAIVKGHLEIVKYLLKNVRELDINWQDDYFIKLAAENCHLDIVKYLYENGANISAENYYTLRYSAKNGCLEVVKYLLELGADIHAEHDDALLLALKNGHLDVVKYLVSKGAKLRIIDDSLLEYLLQKSYYNIITYLISIDINITPISNKLLKSIINIGDLNKVKYLMENRGKNRYNLTDALTHAVDKKQYEIAKYLMSIGAKPDILLKYNMPKQLL